MWYFIYPKCIDQQVPKQTQILILCVNIKCSLKTLKNNADNYSDMSKKCKM